MSIQTEIDRIIAAVGNAHKKVKEKGGTTAEPYLVGNLEAAIDSIPEGVTLPALTNPGAAADLLTGKELINAAGEKVTGSMQNRGAVSATLDLDTTSYTPAQGYHSGSGKVQVDSSINTAVDTQADLIAQIKSEHETQIAAIKTALEGKAAGGGGASDVSCEIISARIVDNGMYEPGINEYVITVPNLNASTRHIIAFIIDNAAWTHCLFYRTHLADDFTFTRGHIDYKLNNEGESGSYIDLHYNTGLGGITGENEITLYGAWRYTAINVLAI